MTKEEFDSGIWIGQDVEIFVSAHKEHHMNGMIGMALYLCVNPDCIMVQFTPHKFPVHFNNLIQTKRIVVPLPLPG